MSEQIQNWLDTIQSGNSFYELRAIDPNGGTPRASFHSSRESFIDAVNSMDGRYLLFSPFNPIDQKKLTSESSASADYQMARRSWLALDIDPVRQVFNEKGEQVKGMCATADEKAKAHGVARAAYDYLTGFDVQPTVIDSGNGYYVMTPINEPNDADTYFLIKEVLRGFAAKFNTKFASVDPTSSNASRILGVPGTVNCKGTPSSDRPHRRRKIVKAGSQTLLTRSQLAEIAQLAPMESISAEQAVKENAAGGVIATSILGPEWVENFLDEFDLSHDNKQKCADGFRWVMHSCPFGEHHNSKDLSGCTAIVQRPNGIVCFCCKHTYCQNISFSQLRQYLKDLNLPVPVAEPELTEEQKAQRKIDQAFESASPETALEMGALMAFGDADSKPILDAFVNSCSLPADTEFDFVENYVATNDRFESPPKLHELMAISAIGAVANRNNVTLHYAGRETPMDMWAVGLFNSGGGKNEAANCLRDLVSPACNGELCSSNNLGGSAEYFYQELADCPNKFWLLTEADGFIGKLNKSTWEGVKPWLTDLYDSTHVPSSIKHRKNKAGSTNTPDIDFTVSPRVNILGLTNTDWFVEAVADSDARGGFLARMIFVPISDSSRSIHYVKQPDPARWQKLQEKFIRIAQLSGPADISQIYSADENCPYASWYDETSKRWRASGVVANIFFKRWRVHVLKLAVIFEMSSSETLKVSVESFKRATNWLRQLETSLFKFTDDGFSGEALRLQRKENFFREAKTEGRTAADYNKKYRGDKPPQRRKQDFDNLLEQGVVVKLAARVDDTGAKQDPKFVHISFYKQTQGAEQK